MEKNKEFINQMGTHATNNVIISLLDKLITLLQEKLGGLFEKFIPQIKDLLGVFAKFLNLDDIIAKLQEFIAKVVESGKEAIADFLAGIPVFKTAVNFIYSKIKDTAYEVYQNVKAFIGKVFHIDWEKFDAKIKEIYESIKEAFDKFAKKAEEALEIFLEKIDELWDKVKDFFEKYVAGKFVDEVPIEVERGMAKFYQGMDGGQRSMMMAQARRKYNEMVTLLVRALGEEKAKEELDRLQKVYPNNYVRQAAEVKSRLK